MSLSYTTGNPNNLTGGTNASMNDIQGPFVDIRTFLTDGSAAVNDLILASPTNPVWRTVLSDHGQNSSLTTGVFYYNNSSVACLSGTSQGGITALWVPPTAGDIAVAGKTTRLRVRVAWLANSTLPGINITWGLYPVTGTSGSGGSMTVTLGTVIAGSTAAQAAAGFSAGQGIATGSSFDFSAVTGAVAYVIGVTGSGSQAAGSLVGSQAFLEIRHT